MIQIPFMPPSSNNCYTMVWARRIRVMTAEAKAFKHRVITEIVPNYLPDISRLDKGAIYAVHYRIFFNRDDVLTKTYGKKKGAESPYKKMDLENRLKLLSDVVSASIGIDDSQFFTGMQEKYSCEVVGGVPQVHIFIRKTSLQEYGFR